MKTYVLAALLVGAPVSAVAEPGHRAALLEEISQWKTVLESGPLSPITQRFLPPLDALAQWAGEGELMAPQADVRRSFDAWKRDVLAAGFGTPSARISATDRVPGLAWSGSAIADAAIRGLARPDAASLDVTFDGSRSGARQEQAPVVAAGAPLATGPAAAARPGLRVTEPPLAYQLPSSDPLERLRAKLVGMGVIRAHIFDVIVRQARALGVDPYLSLALTHAESSFRVNAVSRAGAKGLMQLMPKTARWLGLRTEADMFDPVKNVGAGLRYLRDQLQTFKSDSAIRLVGLQSAVNFGMAQAVAAYNAGPGKVRKYRGIPPYSETVKHVRRVMGLREFYKTIARQPPDMLLA